MSTMLPRTHELGGAVTRMTTRSMAALAVAASMMMVAANCSGGDDANGTAGSARTAASTAPESPAPDSTAPESTASGGGGEAQEPEATATTVAEGEDSGNAGPGDESGDDDYLFDQEQLHTFEINLPDDALAALDADPTAEEYVEGSLTFEGETIEPIGVRYKGSIGAFIGCVDGPDPFAPSGAKTCTKLSMRLKMNWSDPDTEFYGVRTVQLHSLNFDQTLMHERLGYWMFREMGIPAPRSTHARVMVNGEYVGVFALTETIDGRFTRANFDDGTGNLYKEIWPLDTNGAAQTPDAFSGGLQTNEDEPSAEIISAFATELAAAAPEDRVAVLDRWTDLETLLTTIVVDRAIRNDDGPLHWYCFGPCAPHNFFWYEDPSTLKVTLIPWDLDLSFDSVEPNSLAGPVIAIADRWGEITDDCRPFTSGSFGLQQKSAACDPLLGSLATLDDDFERIRADLLAGPFSEERIDEQIAAWTAQIDSSVAEAAELHDDALSVARWESNLARFTQAITKSRSSDGR